MNNPVVLIGRETFIGNKLYERLVLEGQTIVSLGYGDSSKLSTTNINNNLSWNRSSRIAAKTATRELKRLYGVPQEVFLVFGTKKDELFPDLTMSYIEEIIDNHLKSYVYIVQEFYQLALKEGAETAFYFIIDDLFDSKRPLGSAVNMAFKTYTEAIMNNNSNFYMAGFELCNSDDEGFLNYLLKITSMRSAKKRNVWHSYPRLTKIFG